MCRRCSFRRMCFIGYRRWKIERGLKVFAINANRNNICKLPRLSTVRVCDCVFANYVDHDRDRLLAWLADDLCITMLLIYIHS